MRNLALLVIAILSLWVFASSFGARSASAESALVAYWNFDEGSGLTAHDSSGNGNDGTIHGAVWVAGKYGNALQFDGVDDYVEVPDNWSLDISGTIEISAWVKAGIQTAPGGELKIKEIVEKGDRNVLPAGYALRISDNEPYDTPNAGPNGAGYANFDLNMANYPTWPDWSFHINSVTRVDDNNWHFVDATYDGSVMRMYVDNVLETSFTVSSPIYTNSLTLRIGGGHGGRFLSGLIDEVKIYGSSQYGVGGVAVQIDKFGLLAPYIVLASAIIAATVATALYIKHIEHRKKKQ